MFDTIPYTIINKHFERKHHFMATLPSSYVIYFIQCTKYSGCLRWTNFNYLKNIRQERGNEQRNILVSRSSTTKSFTLKTSKRRRLLNVSFQIKLRRNKARSTPKHFTKIIKEQTNSKTFISSPLYPPPTQNQASVWPSKSWYWDCVVLYCWKWQLHCRHWSLL